MEYLLRVGHERPATNEEFSFISNENIPPTSKNRKSLLLMEESVVGLVPTTSENLIRTALYVECLTKNIFTFLTTIVIYTY